MGYDAEFRQEILEVFFDSGLSFRKFASDYGMSKNTLYRWAQEDPRYESVRKKTHWRKYSPEYKYKAVQMVIIDGMSSRKVAKIMGCKYGALVSNWVREYKEKGVIGVKYPDKPIGKKKPETQRANRSKSSSLEEYVRELESENKKLEKENERLRFQTDIAHAIVEVRSKKESGLDVSRLTNVEKTQVVDMLRPQYLQKDLLLYLSLAPSSYSYCKQIQRRSDKYAREREIVIEIFAETDECYGYRRIALDTRKESSEMQISERIVRRIMREEDLYAKQTSKRSYNSYRGAIGKVAANTLNREFKATRPLEKVVTDVTEFRIAGRRVYLSPLIDLYAGEVLSYSIGLSPTVEFVMGMFDENTRQRLKGSGALVHSDQGFQYQHIAYQSVLKELECTQSMSRKGNCLDNAPVESFFARLKTEFYYGRIFSSVEDFYERLDKYIWWYNHRRIKVGLGGLSPVEYREAHLRKAV